MANSSNDPGKRDDDLGDPAGPGAPRTPGEADRDVESTPGEGTLVAAGRDDLRDPDAPEPTLVAAGRDDLLDERESHAAGSRESIGAAAATSPHDPIGPGGDEPPDGPHHEEHEDGDEHGRSFAARALMLLIFALVIFGLSLWLVPNVAPHLPAGIARHLMPGQAELDERLAMLDERIGTGGAGVSDELAALREQVAAMAERVEAAEQAAATAEASSAEAVAAAQENAAGGEAVAQAETAAAEAGEAAAAAARDTASLEQRVADFEVRMAELSDQVQALGDSLAEGGADGEATTPELAAAFSALRSEVERMATQEDLRSARAALQAEIQQAVQALPPADAIVVAEELEALRRDAEGALDLLDTRIAEVQATAERAADTAGAAEQAATTAVGQVDEAIRDARLAAASASLTSRLTNGVAFADALDEAAALMGTPPPEQLAAVAEEGVATTAELLRGFGRPARDAIEADIEARTGGGVLGQASARLRSVVGGRPADEQPGDTVEAILSRVEARLVEGDAAAALAEAETLPEPAQAALGDWLEALRARVAAVEAAGNWLSPAGGGTQG